jgi:hypothetical protein
VAQGYPPRRSAGMPAGGRRGQQDEPGRRGRGERPRAERFDDGFDQSDEDLPPWAGLGIRPTGPGGRPMGPPRSPADTDADRQQPGAARGARPGRRAATRARKGRRKVMAVGAAGVIVLAVLALWATNTWPFAKSKPAPVNSGLITTFQKGEFRTVPNACGAISSTLLGQYLPGKVSQVSQSAGSATQSQCTWTLDTKPNFRVLTVSSQAYSPNLLATGDGSATFSAIDAYGELMQGLQSPPKKSKLPKAQMGTAVGLGSAAFTALQVFHVGGDVTAETTVVVRDRNVIIDVTMQGQEHGGGFGPVPEATLRAAALAAAHEVLAGIH